MSIMRASIVAALALAAGALAEKAHADEAYVCDAGRIVYVKPGELEAKKLNDPCIARYFEAVPSTRAAAKAAAEVAADSATKAPVHPAVATVDVAPRRQQAGEVPPDFRNVRIINAQPGESAWFVHKR